ncbi:DUF11 domain-containing protein [Patescibacteria group bacterium]|nr:DUF11 domain-containing protein [Patescibacteria group bacterium]MBU1759069.1 DUF11 domain-containing protein [Patescibacteria group bacterium]
MKGYDRCDQTTNHAYIISDNAEQAEAHIMFNCATPDANLSITKTASTSAIHLGGTIGFTITITNNGDTINNLQINDIWPDQTCITPDTNVTSNMTLQTNGNFSWTLPGALPQGQTLTINLNGQVVNADACAAVGPFTNTAIYDYTLVGIQHTGQASAMFNILATPYANIDFQKTILQAG